MTNISAAVFLRCFLPAPFTPCMELRRSYNAKRLAVTSINHAGWAATISAARTNPYADYLHWELTPAHVIYDVCDGYAAHDEGLGEGNWPIDAAPLPHPFCTCLWYVDTDKTLDEIGRELRAWEEGESNPRLDQAFGERERSRESILQTAKYRYVDVTSEYCRSTIHIGQREMKGGEKEEKGFKSVRMLLRSKFYERNSFSMSSITQDMKYRQSLVNFAIRYGAGKASRKYNRARSYVYFWLNRYDGTLESLACRSRRPHHHPNEHSEQEIELLRNMCRRNPRLGRVELWCRLRKRGYTRSLSGLYRIHHKLHLQGLFLEWRSVGIKNDPF